MSTSWSWQGEDWFGPVIYDGRNVWFRSLTLRWCDNGGQPVDFHVPFFVRDGLVVSEIAHGAVSNRTERDTVEEVDFLSERMKEQDERSRRLEKGVDWVMRQLTELAESVEGLADLVQDCRLSGLIVPAQQSETALPLPIVPTQAPPQCNKMSLVMPRFTRWLQDSIYLQLQTGNLFRGDEALVHGPKKTSSSANAAENAGDEFITRGSGRTIVYNILLMLPGMAHVGGEHHDAIAEDLVRYFAQNVGFGPYAAEVLGLRHLYSFTPGLILNREILAGLFEETLHVLQREGMNALVKHILMWCVGCVLFMLNRSQQSGFLEQLDPEAYSLVFRELKAHQLHYPHQVPRFRAVFNVDDADSVFNGWVNLCMREANACGGAVNIQSIVPVESAQQRRGGHMRSINQGNQTLYYMDLLCYEHGCPVSDQTSTHEYEHEVYEEAARMGWARPSTRRWTRARCPQHAW